jgi:hypothetical protein
LETKKAKLISSFQEESRLSFRYQPKESKESKIDRLTHLITKVTGIGRRIAEDIADAIIRNRNLLQLAVQKHWPMNEEGFVEGPHGALHINEIRALVS